MPESSLVRRLLLPELHLTNASYAPSSSRSHLSVEKISPFEVCPRCATPSGSVYDYRTVVVKDAPLREKHVTLHIRKRRFSCHSCGRPFTEPIPGIKKGARTTQRYKRSLLWACEKFSDLSSVRRAYACSAGFLYKALYAQLELERRKRLYPWPKVVGIDEHHFRRNRKLGLREFVSVLVDFKGRRVMEVVKGRSGPELESSLAHIPGRENVRFIVLDLCEPFKAFASAFFPHAKRVADKFHVLRLLSAAINRRRKAVTGDRRSLPLRRLLLRNGRDLDSHRRFALRWWLSKHPELREVYEFKEALHGFYRIRGPGRAARALVAMTERMSLSALPEIQTLRKTLLKWKDEILAYFSTRLTNGRTEGFNNKAKLVQRRAYGYRSFQNYRLRLLNACA